MKPFDEEDANYHPEYVIVYMFGAIAVAIIIAVVGILL